MLGYNICYRCGTNYYDEEYGNICSSCERGWGVMEPEDKVEPVVEGEESPVVDETVEVNEDLGEDVV